MTGLTSLALPFASPKRKERVWRGDPSLGWRRHPLTQAVLAPGTAVGLLPQKPVLLGFYVLVYSWTLQPGASGRGLGMHRTLGSVIDLRIAHERWHVRSAKQHTAKANTLHPLQ